MRGSILTGRPLAERSRVISAALEWAANGWNVTDPVVRDAIEQGIPSPSGGAQGLNPAVFMNNAPPPGSYVIAGQGNTPSSAFDTNTERNDVPQPSVAWPGFGGRIDQRIINVGVLARIRLSVQLSAVVAGTGSVTSLYPFPWNLLQEVVINANGGSAIIDCQGLDLRARRAVVTGNAADTALINAAPGMDTGATISAAAPYRPIGKEFPGVIANGTYPINMSIDISIAHSMRSLIGALFAQSDQTYLNTVVNTANQPNTGSGTCFTITSGSSITITGSIFPELTFFSIPTYNAQNGRIVLLPPGVNWLHEFIYSDFQFSNTGDVIVPLTRTNGQLRRIFSYIDNGGAAQIAPTALNNIRWNYGGNQTPRNYQPPVHLIQDNQAAYNGIVDPNYVILDFERDNVQRDVVYPRGLAELDQIYNIPSTQTINANAHVHTVLETLTTV